MEKTLGLETGYLRYKSQYCHKQDVTLVKVTYHFLLLFPLFIELGQK